MLATIAVFLIAQMYTTPEPYVLPAGGIGDHTAVAIPKGLSSLPTWTAARCVHARLDSLKARNPRTGEVDRAQVTSLEKVLSFIFSEAKKTGMPVEEAMARYVAAKRTAISATQARPLKSPRGVTAEEFVGAVSTQLDHLHRYSVQTNICRDIGNQRLVTMSFANGFIEKGAVPVEDPSPLPASGALPSGDVRPFSENFKETLNYLIENFGDVPPHIVYSNEQRQELSKNYTELTKNMDLEGRQYLALIILNHNAWIPSAIPDALGALADPACQTSSEAIITNAFIQRPIFEQLNALENIREVKAGAWAEKLYSNILENTVKTPVPSLFAEAQLALENQQPEAFAIIAHTVVQKEPTLSGVDAMAYEHSRSILFQNAVAKLASNPSIHLFEGLVDLGRSEAEWVTLLKFLDRLPAEETLRARESLHKKLVTAAEIRYENRVIEAENNGVPLARGEPNLREQEVLHAIDSVSKHINHTSKTSESALWMATHLATLRYSVDFDTEKALQIVESVKLGAMTESSFNNHLEILALFGKFIIQDREQGLIVKERLNRLARVYADVLLRQPAEVAKIIRGDS